MQTQGGALIHVLSRARGRSSVGCFVFRVASRSPLLYPPDGVGQEPGLDRTAESKLATEEEGRDAVDAERLVARLLGQHLVPPLITSQQPLGVRSRDAAL